ncbi:glycosyltransferase [Novipirellula sp. SH528]|uniref:glycosyltransferase n=1 Tax=Novipirellula sp. SH528 TaxID=3454466 RepID=UPI003F9FE115
MTRVCHLAKYYDPFNGGIETHVQTLARGQFQQGMDVTVACVNHLDGLGNDVWCHRLSRTAKNIETDNGVHIERFGKFGTLARYDFCRGLTKFVRHACENFDILHLHVPNPAFTVALACVKKKIPLVVTYHSDIVKQQWLRVPFRLIENVVFSKVDRFIVATEAYAVASPVLSEYRARTQVIPFGLDLDTYINPPSASIAYAKGVREKAAGEPVWLCIGRLVYYKGFEHAIRALAMCPGRLIIVGSGPLRPSLQLLACELGVSDRIEWLERLSQEELIGAYQAATALWFPSVMRSEAFGFVQIEAMACGCPVINTSIAGSGVSWVSKHGESGLTVPVADAIALAKAASQIHSQPRLRQSLSEGASMRASELFSLEPMVTSTMSLYNTLLGLSENVASGQPDPQPAPLVLK